MSNTLVCFSNIDWGFLYQRHQHLMNELAENDFFDKIIYVENLGVRNLTLKDYERVINKVSRTKQIKRDSHDKKNSKIIVHSPIFIPIHNKLVYNINAMLLKNQLKKYIEDGENLFIWNFMPHPVVEKLIEELKPNAYVYDCIDDLKSFTAVNKNAIASEKRLIKKADIVYATSLTLLEYCKNHNGNSKLLRNAVNYDHFKQNINYDRVTKLKKKYGNNIIGYFGAIFDWFDLDLLEKLALEYHDYNIIIIGPVNVNIDHLQKYENLYFLGSKDYSELPTYLQIFKLGIIPFKINDLTKNTNPVKLYEYFTVGIPVVATYMPELEEYNELVYLSNSHEGFIDNVHLALKKSMDEKLGQQRIEISKKNTWSNRVIEPLEFFGKYRSN